MSEDRTELHRMVDELGDEQVAVATALLRELQPRSEVPSQPRRRLSFIGAYDSGRSDVASRSSKILREELGQADPHG